MNPIDHEYDSGRYHRELSSAKNKFRFELEEDNFIKNLDWKLEDIKKSLRYVRAGLPETSNSTSANDTQKEEKKDEPKKEEPKKEEAKTETKAQVSKEEKEYNERESIPYVDDEDKAVKNQPSRAEDKKEYEGAEQPKG